MATNHVIPMKRKTISLNQMQNLDWESLIPIVLVYMHGNCKIINTDLGSYCCRESDLVNNTTIEAESMCVTEAVIFKTVRCTRAVSVWCQL